MFLSQKVPTTILPTKSKSLGFIPDPLDELINQ